jgi:hypothetical protein
MYVQFCKYNYYFGNINTKDAAMGALSVSNLLQILLYPLHRLYDILAMAEGRQPEIPFPAGTEAAAGGADHVAFC